MYIYIYRERERYTYTYTYTYIHTHIIILIMFGCRVCKCPQCIQNEKTNYQKVQISKRTNKQLKKQSSMLHLFKVQKMPQKCALVTTTLAMTLRGTKGVPREGV